MTPVGACVYDSFWMPNAWTAVSHGMNLTRTLLFHVARSVLRRLSCESDVISVFKRGTAEDMLCAVLKEARSGWPRRMPEMSTNALGNSDETSPEIPIISAYARPILPPSQTHCRLLSTFGVSQLDAAPPSRRGGPCFGPSRTRKRLSRRL